jgi:hypothetical protein
MLRALSSNVTTTVELSKKIPQINLKHKNGKENIFRRRAQKEGNLDVFFLELLSVNLN